MRAIVIEEPKNKKYIIKQIVIIIILFIFMFITSKLINKNAVLFSCVPDVGGPTLTRIEKAYINGQNYGMIDVKSTTDKSYKEKQTVKGPARYFVIRDSKTKDILAIYKPYFNGENVSKDVTYSILDKAPKELTEPTYTNIKAENFWDINKTIKEYNSKYKKSVLSYESGAVYPSEGVIYLCTFAFMMCNLIVFIKIIKLMGYLLGL